MKHIFRIFTIGAILLFSPQIAIAEGECDKYKTSYDRTYCFAKLFIESDNELNTVYKDLRKVIKTHAREQLTLVQREWMEYRDDICQPVAGTINVDCNYRLNRDRTEYLRDRLRECRAGTCRDDKIGQKSWE
ncbi:MAG: lysozyme inhibitor LprI family protein [Syntrophobacterales bacterium]|nr:lysozyme inhibitor LprI family protein [Syntrophobacterales bacterium]